MSEKPTDLKPEQRAGPTIEKASRSHRIESALRKSGQKYRQILANIRDVFLQTDFAGQIIDISPSITRYTGYTPEELIGTSVLDLYDHPEDRKTLLEAISKTGEVIDYELRFRSKNNQLLYGSLNSHILYDDAGNPVALEGWVRDITDRKHVEEKLRESEEKYRSLVDHIAIGVSMISPDMRILTLNNQMRKWVPHVDPTKKPLCYRAFNNPPRDGICAYCPTIKTLQTGEVYESTTDTPFGDEIRNFRIISSPIKDQNGNVIAAIEMVEDITERRRNEDHIRRLSQQILKAHEDERQMISRELHDSVAQELISLKIALEMLFEQHPQLPRDITQKLSVLSGVLDQSITTVRNLSYDLRPPGLTEFGLVQTLAAYCEEFEKNTTITVDFRTAGLKTDGMSSLAEINLYRLIQEGLNNVRKHAEADRVTVKLMGAHPNIILRIEDNGKGFDVKTSMAAPSREKRMGLRTMRERVELLQGRMTVHSEPNDGTRILIKFPMKDDSDGPETPHLHY